MGMPREQRGQEQRTAVTSSRAPHTTVPWRSTSFQKPVLLPRPVSVHLASALTLASSPLTPLPPLSPVPELPTELDLDDNIPLARFPSSVLAPELQTYSAESSSAALHRARVLHSASPHPDDLRRRSPGRSEDGDELGSDGNEKRERYKRRKGLDGKLIRASAKPRKRIDKQLQIERHGQKPPEKVAPRAKTLSEMRLKAMVRGKTRETQLAPCIRPRYGKWGKCTQCVSKIGGDSCRFRNYRIFPYVVSLFLLAHS